MLWDLAGRDGVEDIQASYVRGASGILYVVDGTRRETFDQFFELREICADTAGDVPSVVAVNKADLVEEWQLTDGDYARFADEGLDYFVTSARTGDGVEEAFLRLAAATLGT